MPCSISEWKRDLGAPGLCVGHGALYFNPQPAVRVSLLVLLRGLSCTATLRPGLTSFARAARARNFNREASDVAVAWTQNSVA